MADMLNPDTWKNQWEAFMKAPYIIFPLIISVMAAVWWLRGAILQGQIDVLVRENASQNAIFENRRQLAAEKVELANQAKSEVERQLNDLKASSVGNDALVTMVSRLEQAIEKVSAANNAVVKAAVGAADGRATVSGVGAVKLESPK